MEIKNIIKNITPAVAVMVVGLGGAYLTYDKFFSDKISATQASTFEPAAGEDMSAPVMEEAAPMMEEHMDGAMEEAAPMMEEHMENAVECMMDEEGNPVMNEDGSACVPMPMSDETAPMMEDMMEAAPATDTPAE